MRDILRKYILIMFTLGSAIMIIVHISLDFNIARNQDRASFENTINQIIDIIKRNNAEQSRFALEIQSDYVVRARSIATILYTNEKYYEQEKLQKIADFLEIDEINIFNKEGYISYSSKSEKIGFYINDNDKTKEFLPLLHSKNLDDSYIQSITINDKEMIYIGVKPITDENGVGFIQIGLVPERVISYREHTSILSIFSRSALEDSRVIILDGTTGELLGCSNNMYNDIKNNYYEVFKQIKTNDSKIVNINNNKYYTVYKNYKEYLIVGLKDTSNLYKDLQWHILSVILCMVVVCFISIYILYRILDKKIIYNIKDIIKVLNKIEKGDFNSRVQEKGCKEILEIECAINNMINVLVNMGNRLEKVIISTNLSISLFEYIKDLNQFLITNNTMNILSINEYEWSAIKDDAHLCKKLLSDIQKNPVTNNEGIYLYNNKFIKLNLLEEENGYFGFIEDVTSVMIEKDNMISELKLSQFMSRTDTLTGLLNKGAITSIVTKYMQESNNGVLILFDLDNFKTVNDIKGHPEGDRLLKLFANTIKQLFRVDDYVARFGGDEFAVFMCRQISNEELKEKLDLVIYEVREALKEYYTEFHISVSIGAVCITSEINNFEELYTLADRKLYESKNNGKDSYTI